VFICELHLVGNKRLLLRNVQEIRFTATQIYQSIIGTNGSGKTTLIKEMTPMPASQSDYIKGGRKDITFLDKGSKYRLISDFTNGNRHTFIKDGEILNDNGTASVQKELISQHFGIDAKLYAVLLDDDLFTYMSPNERREWIMRLSGNDLGFAMKLFHRLKTEERNMQGVVKHLSKRVSEEVDKLPSESETERLKTTATECKQDLEILMDNRDNQAPAQHVVEARFDNMLSRLTSISMAILNANRPQIRRSLNLKNMDMLDTELDETKSRIARSEAQYDTLWKETERLEAYLKTMNENKVSGLEELDRELEMINRDIKERRARVSDRFFVQNANELLIITSSIVPELIDIMSEMPLNIDNKHGEEQSKLKLDRKASITSGIEKAVRSRDSSIHQLEHIQKTEETNCPKCGYHWKLGVKDGEVEQLTKRIEDINAWINERNQELTVINEYLEENSLFRSYISRFARIVNQNKGLKPLWDWIAEDWAKGANPKAVLPRITAWKQELEICSEIEQLNRKLSEGLKAREEIAGMGDGSIEHFTSRLENIGEEISSHLTELQASGLERKALEEFRSYVTNITTKGQELQTLAAEIEAETEVLFRSCRNGFINKQISEQQSTLAHAEVALNKAMTATAVIEDLKRSRDEAIQDLESYKILVQELSPTDGLIADQVRGFIDCFTEQMNNIIGSIWTSDLRVLPCETEDDELNFKFPMSVHNSDLKVPDVRQGSASQRDIVNFAFKLVVYLYLGLEDFPLYLDELAITLDEQHRFNIINFLKQYVESKRCSQMFLISHYAQQHGAFPLAEVCVMDTTNLVNIPGVYNQHVMFK